MEIMELAYLISGNILLRNIFKYLLCMYKATNVIQSKDIPNKEMADKDSKKR